MSSYKNLSEFLVRWSAMKQSIRPVLAIKLKSDTEEMTEKIRSRVKSGENAKGGQFTDYSDRHRKAREKKGLQTGYKDFWFNGVMFNGDNFSIVKEENNGDKVTLTLGFKGTNIRNNKTSITNEELLYIHSEHEGKESIIATNEKEEDALVQALTDEVFNFIKQSIG